MSDLVSFIDLSRSQRAEVPPPGLVALVAQELQRIALAQGNRRAATAINKAEFYLAAGIVPMQAAQGILLPSSRGFAQVHRVEGAYCSCDAGMRGQWCWHLGVLQILTAAWQEVAAQFGVSATAGQVREALLVWQFAEPQPLLGPLPAVAVNVG